MISDSGILEVIATADGGATGRDSMSYNIDRVDPDTVLISTPPISLSGSQSLFVFDTTETGSTFECTLDGGTFAACTSPVTYS